MPKRPRTCFLRRLWFAYGLCGGLGVVILFLADAQIEFVLPEARNAVVMVVFAWFCTGIALGCALAMLLLPEEVRPEPAAEEVPHA